MDRFTLVQRHKSRGIKTWYIRIANGSTISYKSTKKTVKTEAMKFFAEYVNKVGGHIGNGPVGVDEIVVGDEVKRWLDIQLGKFGEDSNTYHLYRSNMRLLTDYLADRRVRMLSDVTKQVAQGLSSKMMSEGKKASSIEISLRCIKMFFKWVIEYYDLNIRSPFENVSRPKVTTRMADFWTQDECDAIIDNADNEYWQAYFGLQCYAGLRSFEAAKVCVEDINGDTITIRQDKEKRDTVLPISGKLKILLDAVTCGRTKGNLFDGHIGTHHATVYIHLRRAAIKAGLEDTGRIYPHRLRHSFASNLLRNGVDIKSVQTLGRWSSPEILLKHYAGVIPDDLKDAVNKL